MRSEYSNGVDWAFFDEKGREVPMGTIKNKGSEQRVERSHARVRWCYLRSFVDSRLAAMEETGRRYNENLWHYGLIHV